MSNSFQCPGFVAAGISAGIKKRGGLDLGLIFSQIPAAAAGMFTRNRVQAAPVVISRQRTQTGSARAIVANAGCANCCTGAQGLAHAGAMSSAAASGLHVPAEEVLVASTGVIGAPLPIEKIHSAMPELIGRLRPDGFDEFAHSIMTTDTVPKLAVRTGSLDGRPFTILAAAKGAGMIRPYMATMLCFVCTDIAAPAQMLQPILRKAVDRSLNCISIDGDTSTNDTVVLLANGASGVEIANRERQQAFQAVLDDLLLEIARRLVKDGEGVTKLVEITVQGAASHAEAFRIADTVAHSPLVKTAFFGEDANWGRIMGAAGRAGVPIDPEKVDIFFDGVQMVEAGRGCGPQREAQVTAVMKQPEFSVTIDLHGGAGKAVLLTCDFSIDYVKINADYRS